ncbi:MAG: P-type conjugative transfer protein TrbJ [Gammaproteobacteria bacterium]
MKKRFVLSLASVLALLAWSLPASAQWAVVDVANLAENILDVANSATQIENQIAQLQNEAQMLVNQAKNLQHLDINALNRLRVTLATTSRLLAEAQGLGFDLTSVQQQLARAYPSAYGSAVTREQMSADSQERWSNSYQALRTAMSLQAQAAENIPDDEAVLADLIDRSQSAEGALQAAQATNQLLALQSRQTMQTQQLAIVQDRSVALEQARAVEADERSRALRRRFMTGVTTYTGEPVATLRE